MSITFRQFLKPIQVVRGNKGGCHETVADISQNQAGVSQLERCFGEYSIAGKQRLCHLLRYANCPAMVLVSSVSERDEKTSVGDCLHFFENPFLIERSGGPSTLPASRIKRPRVSARARSS